MKVSTEMTILQIMHNIVTSAFVQGAHKDGTSAPGTWLYLTKLEDEDHYRTAEVQFCSYRMIVSKRQQSFTPEEVLAFSIETLQEYS